MLLDSIRLASAEYEWPVTTSGKRKWDSVRHSGQFLRDWSLITGRGGLQNGRGGT